MIVNLPHPELAAGVGVERVDVGCRVAEVDASRHGARRRVDRRSPCARRPRGKCPADAAGARVKRVDGAVLAADEHAPAGDRRLRPGHGRVGKPEGPLEREPRHVRGRQAGVGGGLKARVPVDGSSRTSAARARNRPPGIRGGAAAGVGPAHVARDRRAAEELRHGPALGARERAPCTRIAPVTRLSTIDCGGRPRSASGAGARESAAPP